MDTAVFGLLAGFLQFTAQFGVGQGVLLMLLQGGEQLAVGGGFALAGGLSVLAGLLQLFTQLPLAPLGGLGIERVLLQGSLQLAAGRGFALAGGLQFGLGFFQLSLQRYFAFAGRADFLLSGDSTLLHLGKFQGECLGTALFCSQCFAKGLLLRPSGVQLPLHLVDGGRGVGQLSLHLLALLACAAYQLGDPPLGGFHGPVVEFDGKAGQALDEGFAVGLELFGNLDGQFCNRLCLSNGLTGDVFLPDLFEPVGIAPAQALSQGEAGDRVYA